MGDLWERLRAAQTRPPSAPSEPPPEEAGDQAPPGWRWVSPLVAERTVEFPLEARFWGTLKSDISASEWDGVLCFDTETTGLSGGAGTLPFLVGWARLVPVSEAAPRVEVRQWFLRDMPGEAGMIEALETALEEARTLVSFNGASFDVPLLKSRWALAGKAFPALPHRDALHPARRLWKRLLDSCRLARLEETVLGIQRVDDVPGALVPALWFDYLRRGAASDFATPLEGVLRHHAQDVYSLLCLDLLLAALARNPENPRWEETFGPFPRRTALARPAGHGLLHPDLGSRSPVDFWGLLALKAPDPAVSALERAWNQEKTEAVGLAWADRLKRRGDPRAVEVWTWLWTDRGSFVALEEWLKWLEHRERSPESRTRALALIDQALRTPLWPRAWKDSLERRRQRLERRS